MYLGVNSASCRFMCCQRRLRYLRESMLKVASKVSSRDVVPRSFIFPEILTSLHVIGANISIMSNYLGLC